jgi:hypothetical protein
MKKTIGLGLLLLTGITAFAAPAANYERYDGATARREVVVVKHHNRVPARRIGRARYDRDRR